MASVDDRWYVSRKMPDGTTRKVRTPRHGTGKRWLVRWRDHADVPRKKSFDRKADADREAARIETELARGTYLDPKAGEISFREYAEQWRPCSSPIPTRPTKWACGSDSTSTPHSATCR